MKDVRLLTEPFEPNALVALFAKAHPGLGGLCSFVGEVRIDAGVEALELKHFEPLTLPGMDDLADGALARFDLMGILLIHRTGVMQPGEPIVLAATAARHRRDAIQAVDFAMDHLKSDSWFWKREKVGGAWRWIEPRAQDFADKSRWV